MRHEVHRKYLSNLVGLSVAWPIKIHGVYPQEQKGIVTVDGRYGEEKWGAFVRFEVQGSDFPILNTLEEGHHAFIEGRICEINLWVILIEVTRLEFE
jgi:hypothetical protein